MCCCQLTGSMNTPQTKSSSATRRKSLPTSTKTVSSAGLSVNKVAWPEPDLMNFDDIIMTTSKTPQQHPKQTGMSSSSNTKEDMLMTMTHSDSSTQDILSLFNPPSLPKVISYHRPQQDQPSRYLQTNNCHLNSSAWSQQQCSSSQAQQINYINNQQLQIAATQSYSSGRPPYLSMRQSSCDPPVTITTMSSSSANYQQKTTSKSTYETSSMNSFLQFTTSSSPNVSVNKTKSKL